MNDALKNLASQLLLKNGHSILKNNLIKWSNPDKLLPQLIYYPNNIKKQISKLNKKEFTDNEVINAMSYIIMSTFPDKWRLFLKTGNRYALEIDLLTHDTEFTTPSQNIYEAINTYEMAVYSRGYLHNMEKLGIDIDVEIHGLNDNNEVNPYLKLKKSQIKSLNQLGYAS